MGKFAIEYQDLKYLISALKPALGKSETQPQHQFMKCTVNKNSLKAVAVDGYRVHTVCVPIGNESNEEFSFLLSAFSLPKATILDCQVVDCQVSETEIEFNFGNCKHIERLGEDIDSFINTDKAVPVEPPMFRYGINAKFLFEAIKSLQDDIAVLEFYGELKPLKIHSADKKENDYRIIMPIRIKEDE